MTLFPDWTAEDVADAVAECWDLDGALPVPKFTPTCYACGITGVHARVWRFHERNAPRPGRFKYRCSVSVKCVGCGLVSTFGVPLSDADYRRFTGGKRDRTVHWRDAKRLLDVG
jgi:hypothetical protein